MPSLELETAFLQLVVSRMQLSLPRACMLGFCIQGSCIATKIGSCNLVSLRRTFIFAFIWVTLQCETMIRLANLTLTGSFLHPQQGIRGDLALVQCGFSSLAISSRLRLEFSLMSFHCVKIHTRVAPWTLKNFLPRKKMILVTPRVTTNTAQTCAKMATDTAGQEGLVGRQTKKKHNKYRREKPWDNEDIDHWKVRLPSL